MDTTTKALTCNWIRERENTLLRWHYTFSGTSMLRNGQFASNDHKVMWPYWDEDLSFHVTIGLWKLALLTKSNCSFHATPLMYR